MDGSGYAGYNSYLQPQQPQPGYQTAATPGNMMQPGVNLNTGVPLGMPGVQPGYVQPGMEGFQQPSLAMSGYTDQAFAAQVAMPQAMPQSGYADLSMGANTMAAMPGQAASYQHPDVMQTAMMGLNQPYTSHLAPPPWRTEQEAAEEGDNTTTDALQLRGTSVFVAGLPRSSNKKQSTLDETIVKRFFSSRCGRVKKLRLQVSRGYCFVVFEKAEAAAAAVALSGTDVILDSTTPDVTTRLVVKYAQDGDTNEPVYRRSAALRASVFTESAAKNVKEILKSSEDMDEFYQAVCNVFSWLETGECTKRNCDQFLHMLQLMSGRASAFKEFDEERTQTRELEDLEWHGSMAHQCEGLRRTFEVANKQKVRDVLSRPQRKNLDSWTNTVVEAAERFRKVFANEANMDDLPADNDPVVPPPPPPAPSAAGGTKRSADAVALAEAEAKLQEQEEALRTARSRINFLEQELKAKSSMGSAEYRVKSYEDEINSLKIQLKTSNGSATQKINNLEAKLGAMQKKLTTLQDGQKEWQAKEKEWLKKQAAWEAQERERRAKDEQANAEVAEQDALKAGDTAAEVKAEGENGEQAEAKQGTGTSGEPAGTDGGEKSGREVKMGTSSQQKKVDVRHEKDQNGAEVAEPMQVTSVNCTHATEKEGLQAGKAGKNGSTAMEVDVQREKGRTEAQASKVGVHDVETEVAAPLSKLHACVAVCLAVYLTSHPHGTTLSDLAEYLSRLSAAQKSLSFDTAIQTVLDSMQAIPGAFQQSPPGNGERIWSFVAYQTLAELWAAGSVDS